MDFQEFKMSCKWSVDEPGNDGEIKMNNTGMRYGIPFDKNVVGVSTTKILDIDLPTDYTCVYAAPMQQITVPQTQPITHVLPFSVSEATPNSNDNVKMFQQHMVRIGTLAKTLKMLIETHKVDDETIKWFMNEIETITNKI